MKTILGLLALVGSGVFFIGGVLGGIVTMICCIVFAIMDIVGYVNGAIEPTFENILWTVALFLGREILGGIVVVVSWVVGFVLYGFSMMLLGDIK